MLRLVVHDYDRHELELRVKDLQETLGPLDLTAFTSRHELLRHIASQPPARPDRLLPLALIDLLGSDRDRLVRGEHLMQTINEHPGLRGRVVVIAFTRYGHSARDEVLLELGVRGVLAPGVLLQADLADGVAQRLELLARGVKGRLIRIGASPSPGEEQVLEMLESFFPTIVGSVPESERWTVALKVLDICRLAADGFDERAIMEKTGVQRRFFSQLKRDLILSPEAHAAGAIRPASTTPDLSRVGEALFERGSNTEARWILATDREELAPAPIRWAQERFEDFFPMEDGREVVDSANRVWLPPASVPLLRMFFDEYAEVTRLAVSQEVEEDLGKTHPSRDQLQNRVALAVRRVGEAFGLDPQFVRRQVVHAIVCLEEAVRDDPGDLDSFADLR